MEDRISILVVDDEADIRIFVQAILSSDFPCYFFEAESGTQAVDILNNQNMDLVICDYNMPFGNGDMVFEKVSKMNPQPQFILFTGDDEDVHTEFIKKSGCIFLQKPFRFKELSEVTANLMNIVPVLKNNEKFTTFSASALLNYDYLPFDIYVKLGNTHQIKYINGKRPFSKSDKERLKKLSSDEVYIDTEELKIHLAQQERVVFQSLILPKNGLEFNFQLNSSHTEINRLGLKKVLDDKEISDLTQKNLKTVFALSFKSKAFKGLLDWVQTHEGNSKKNHAILITLFCNIIIKNLKSSFYDFKTYLYFGYAAVLHDMSLDEFYIKNENRIVNAIKLKSPINKDEQKIMLNHVEESLNTVKGWSHCPIEVLKIIETHHEKPNGSGFPKKLSGENIEDLSAIFIVAHDVALALMDLKQGDDINILLHKLGEEYAGYPHFEEPLKVLMEKL